MGAAVQYLIHLDGPWSHGNLPYGTGLRLILDTVPNRTLNFKYIAWPTEMAIKAESSDQIGQEQLHPSTPKGFMEIGAGGVGMTVRFLSIEPM